VLKEESLFKYENGKVQKTTCRKCLSNKHRLELKLEMFEHLGNVCACCKEDNPAFLCLDHINNDGHIENRRLGEIIAMARKSGWDKTRYQVLCFNCNMAKANFGGVCPHKLLLTLQTIVENKNLYIRSMGRTVGNFDTSNLAAAREVLKQKRLERGEYGRDAATRSKEYRERHPEYKDRKKALRQEKAITNTLNALTPEQLEQLQKMMLANA
jgi:hypothetical protein